jgi:hypothetical protein
VLGRSQRDISTENAAIYVEFVGVVVVRFVVGDGILRIKQQNFFGQGTVELSVDLLPKLGASNVPRPDLRQPGSLLLRIVDIPELGHLCRRRQGSDQSLA